MRVPRYNSTSKVLFRTSYLPPCIKRHLRHNHETLNLLSLLTISFLYIHPLFFFLDRLGVFGGHRLNGCLSVSFFLLTPYGRLTIIAPATNATCHCTLIIRQTARMSTGVDNHNHNSKSDYIDSATRHRSISRSDGSAISPSIEFGKSPDKQLVNMAQTQRSRYLKTGAIIAFIFMVLVWLSPSQPSASNITNGWCSPCAHCRSQN